jgi:hypothetical protein
MCSVSHSEFAAALTEKLSWIIYTVRITELPASCPTLVWKCRLYVALGEVRLWTSSTACSSKITIKINIFYPFPLALRSNSDHGNLMKFLDHTQRRTTVGKTPLEEWSYRRRYFYLTTYDTYNRQTFTPSAGFEPTFPAGKLSQTYALDHAVTGTGKINTTCYTINCYNQFSKTTRIMCPTLPVPDSKITLVNVMAALRRGSAVALLLGLWVRIPPEAWRSVCCDCCVLAGRGLCVGLITRPEEYYWLWCAWVGSRSLETEEVPIHWWLLRNKKKNLFYFMTIVQEWHILHSYIHLKSTSHPRSRQMLVTLMYRLDKNYIWQQLRHIVYVQSAAVQWDSWYIKR